jgi:hypothetical protein
MGGQEQGIVNKTEETIWKLEVVKEALKCKVVNTNQPVQWLGMIELLHDCIHQLGGTCGAAHCDGADEEILTRFIDHCT